MKFEDINKKYTEKVTEWLGKGYWINAGSMSGSQGEVAHVDLTNGTEIIRVLMEDRADHGDGWDWDETTVVVVGRVPEDEHVQIGLNKSIGNTIWNQRLEELEVETFYKIGRTNRNGSQWYGTKAELAHQKNINRARFEARKENAKNAIKVTEKAAEIVLPFVRRQAGCKTVRLPEITEVCKHIRRNWSTNKIEGCYYEVTARGKKFRLA